MTGGFVTSQAKMQLHGGQKLQEKLRPETAINKHNLSFSNVL